MKPFAIISAVFLILTFSSCLKHQELLNASTDEVTSNRATNVNLKTTVGTNVQQFNEVKNSEEERQRLNAAIWYGTNFEPTGFYLPPNTNLQITVSQVAGSRKPTILIGTYYYKCHYDTIPKEYQLNTGVNNIPGNPKGGLIWIRFIAPQNQTADSKVSITFNSGHVRVPIFIKNITTQSDWTSQLNTYNTPTVLLIGDRAYQVYDKSLAVNDYSGVNFNNVLSNADQIWDWENEYLGLDGSAPQHNIKVQNKCLMVQGMTATDWGAMYTNHYGTVYTTNFMLPPFTEQIGTIDGWGTWHEMGHLNQQKWTWSAMGEVTVNLFSLFIERKLGVTPSRLKRNNDWAGAIAFINDANPNKNLDSIPDYYNGVDKVFVRLCMFQQLWLAYGDQLFINLHKKTRNDNPVLNSNFDKKRWFMMAVCSLTNANLANFFKKWGMIPPSEQSIYNDIVNMGLPTPSADYTTYTEDNITQAESGATYKLVSAVNNSSVLDLNSYTPVNGTFVSLWSANSPLSNNQKWLLRSAGAGDFYFKSIIDTTKVLDVGGAIADSTRTMVWTYHGGTSQKWKLQYVSNGYYNIIPSAGTTKNLEVSGGSSANGTKIQIMSKNTNNAQKWKLVKL